MSAVAPRQLHFWAFLQGIGHYPGGWRYRNATPRAVFDLSYYERVGKLIESARFDAIVFGDQLQARGAEGRTPAHLAIPTLDPLTLLAAIGRVTTHVGLVATVSTTYNEPAAVADKFATLDWLTRGRAGWNIVTTAHPASAWNFGAVALPEKSLRYQRADEFVDITKALWDRAHPNHWNANSEVHHHGRFFTMRGALATPQPPQGRPVLVQAGQSGDGRDFAAKTAEAIFCPAPTFEAGKAFRDDVRARLAKFGREADSVKVMPGLSFVLAATETEALAKDRELVELSSMPLCIEYLSESVGVDLVPFDPTAPIPLAHILEITEFPAEDIRKMLEPAVQAGHSLGAFAQNYVRTPRGHHVFRGTPEQLADLMGRWLEGGACDGFTLQPAYMPGELEIFVEQVVPLLQRRGLLRTDYESTTLRGHVGLPRP